MFVGAIFTVSRFGKPVLMLGGHRYNKHTRYHGPKARWVCTRKSSAGCKAVVLTVMNEIIMVNGTHCHQNFQKRFFQNKWSKQIFHLMLSVNLCLYHAFNTSTENVILRVKKYKIGLRVYKINVDLRTPSILLMLISFRVAHLMVSGHAASGVRQVLCQFVLALSIIVLKIK